MFVAYMGGWKELGIHVYRGVSLVTGLHGGDFGAGSTRLRQCSEASGVGDVRGSESSAGHAEGMSAEPGKGEGRVPRWKAVKKR